MRHIDNQKSWEKGSIANFTTEIEHWRTLIKHSYIAKQALDDIIDLMEDAEHKTLSPIRQKLQDFVGTSEFVSQLRFAVVCNAKIAVEHLKTAKKLALDVNAFNWSSLCLTWENKASELIELASKEI
jgi:hypothetical protein